MNSGIHVYSKHIHKSGHGHMRAHRPRRNPRLPTRVLKAKILHQLVGIRFVHAMCHSQVACATLIMTVYEMSNLLYNLKEMEIEFTSIYLQ